jgi:hypothetical protein
MLCSQVLAISLAGCKDFWAALSETRDAFEASERILWSTIYKQKYPFTASLPYVAYLYARTWREKLILKPTRLEVFITLLKMNARGTSQFTRLSRTPFILYRFHIIKKSL